MTLFASTFAYAAAKAAGDGWTEVLAHELAHLRDSTWPGFRTLGEAADLGEPIAVNVHGQTLIARARSAAAGEFLRSEADVWISVDDDTHASAGALAALVEATRATRGFVAAPNWLRTSDRPRLSVRYEGEPTIARVATGQTVFTGRDFSSGWGLVAVHREAIARMGDRERVWAKNELGTFPPLFLESVAEDGRWIGEDFAFCVRAHAAGVTLHGLCDVVTRHAGRACVVSEREGVLSASLF